MSGPFTIGELGPERRIGVRVDHGWIEIWQGADDVWRVTWEPDEGHPDWPGHTYTPGDAHLPDDYPSPADGRVINWAPDPEELLNWAFARWGPPRT